MFKDKKVIVVMPAYNAAKTIKITYDEIISQEIVDVIIIVDDDSSDNTLSICRELPSCICFQHPKNLGYGANQKTCYKLALDEGGDIIIMVHPDYQYTPKLIPAMAALIGNGLYSCVIGSRILGGRAVKEGMPLWKYLANRFLTFVGNVFLGAKLSEYHTGYRAFSRELLEKIDLSYNSNDFVFDNQMLAQVIWHGYTIAEISCPTKYFPEASSINFRRSLKYGIGCIITSMTYRLAKMSVITSKLFPRETRNSH